jgi:hypothetical protein
MDFIVKLPQTIKGFNVITVIVCRLTKRHILILITKEENGTSAEETAKLVYLNIRRQGVRIINTFVSDKRP